MNNENWIKESYNNFPITNNKGNNKHFQYNTFLSCLVSSTIEKWIIQHYYNHSPLLVKIWSCSILTTIHELEYPYLNRIRSQSCPCDQEYSSPIDSFGVSDILLGHCRSHDYSTRLITNGPFHFNVASSFHYAHLYRLLYNHLYLTYLSRHCQFHYFRPSTCIFILLILRRIFLFYFSDHRKH